MSRRVRFSVSLATALAAAVLLLLMAPGGAFGGERGESSSASGDLYFFGRDAVVAAAVAGSVQVYGGSAKVRQPIHGDLIVLGGNITFEEEGRVDGNVISGGGRIDGAEGRVGGHLFPLTSVEGAAATVTKSAVIASLLLVWLFVAVLVTLFTGREIRFSSVEVRASAFHCFALGLVAFTSFVISAILFSYLVPYVVGIPLLAALGIFAVLTKVYGLIAVFHATGALLIRPRTRSQLDSRRWLRGDLAMVVVGVLVLGAIRMIPVVGTVAWSCASVFGIGCALATRFGRREPAFLAWRPAEA